MLDAFPAAPADGTTIDATFVIERLEQAGAALLAMPTTGWSTKLRTSNLEIVRQAMDVYGHTNKRVRPAIPSAAEITRMDEAMGWIPLIPADRYVLRRIVGARSLVNPLTGRHLFPWRRLGTALGADHKAIQRWHAEGIARIVAALTGREFGTGATASRRVTVAGAASIAAAKRQGRPPLREARPV